MLKNKCNLYDGEAMKILPKENQDFITFKNYQHRHFLPFNIYYDTEAMLKNIKDEKGNYQLHLCRHVGVKLVSRYPNLLNDSYK